MVLSLAPSFTHFIPKLLEPLGILTMLVLVRVRAHQRQFYNEGPRGVKALVSDDNLLYNDPLMLPDLLGRLRAGERIKDLRGLDLEGLDLSEVNLSDSDLSGASLRRSDLSRATLYRVNLTGACLESVRLSEALLSDVTLAGALTRGLDTFQAQVERLHVEGGHWKFFWPTCRVGNLDAEMMLPGQVRIGCQTLGLEEWLGGTGKDLAKAFKVGALEQAVLRQWLESLKASSWEGLGWVPEGV